MCKCSPDHSNSGRDTHNHTCTHTHIHTHTYIHTGMCVRTHTHTHTHTQIYMEVHTAMRPLQFLPSFVFFSFSHTPNTQGKPCLCPDVKRCSHRQTRSQGLLKTQSRTHTHFLPQKRNTLSALLSHMMKGRLMYTSVVFLSRLSHCVF